jgi:3-methyladenine DNA glycosylase AlkD/8-oxo-dGTP pyrophosphatase MutT (NUDIX family)
VKTTTLAYPVILHNNKITHVYLGMKQRGFGKDKWNGFGGKLDPNETVDQAMKREIFEEIGIKVKIFQKVGEISFRFKDKEEWNQLVNLFIITDWQGEPKETEEMKPLLFEVTKIPFDLMWQEDKKFLPWILEGKKVIGDVELLSSGEIVSSTVRPIFNSWLVKYELNKYKDNIKAIHSARFFKTKKGDYGYGDIFLGINVPDQRKIAKYYYKSLSESDIVELLQSKVHEHRLTAVFMLIYKYKTAEKLIKNKIFQLYIQNTSQINNWDIVDSSASHIIGHWCYHNNDTKIISKFSDSKDLWENRIAIIAMFYYIDHGDIIFPISIIQKLLSHEHDLIHKALGWVLREIGKHDITLLKSFIIDNYNAIHRTTLRYAIEKFDKLEREKYLSGKFAKV